MQAGQGANKEWWEEDVPPGQILWGLRLTSGRGLGGTLDAGAALEQEVQAIAVAPHGRAVHRRASITGMLANPS
jgi:hypothetical protein